MKVSEAMTRDVRVASPLQKAAKAMAELDAGMLPVGEKDHLVGMITDRDIAIRGIAKGKGRKAKVRDVMTEDVKYCFEDQEVDGGYPGSAPPGSQSDKSGYSPLGTSPSAGRALEAAAQDSQPLRRSSQPVGVEQDLCARQPAAAQE